MVDARHPFAIMYKSIAEALCVTVTSSIDT